MRALHTGADQLFALSNDQPNRDTNEQIDLSSPSGQTSTKLHPSAAHNSFLMRIAGTNHSINSGLRHREPRLTTNETAGLSPSPTKQVVEARGGKSARKGETKKKERLRREIPGLFSWKREFTCGAVRNIMFECCVYWLEAVDMLKSCFPSVAPL